MSVGLDEIAALNAFPDCETRTTYQGVDFLCFTEAPSLSTLSGFKENHNDKRLFSSNLVDRHLFRVPHKQLASCYRWIVPGLSFERCKLRHFRVSVRACFH